MKRLIVILSEWICFSVFAVQFAATACGQSVTLSGVSMSSVDASLRRRLVVRVKRFLCAARRIIRK